MKNEKIVNTFNAIQPGYEAKNRVLDKIMQRRRRKHTVFKTLAPIVAAAAVVCLVLFGSLLLSPQAEDIFIVKAYAAQVREDGSTLLRETEAVDSVDAVDAKPEYAYIFMDGQTNTMYVGIGLQCEGKNIESVEFSADTGFFAVQYIGNLTEASIAGVPAAYRNGELVRFGDDFDHVGGAITLYKNTMGDYLLFWGMDYPDGFELPDIQQLKISVRVRATFSNGTTAEQDVVIDMSDTQMSGGGRPSDEETARRREAGLGLTVLLDSISLDQCEVVKEQTLTYGDTFEYSIATEKFSCTNYFPVTEEAISAAINQGLFDENGVFRQGASLPDDGSDGYIAVIEDNGDGTFTGMLYRVPGWLLLEYMGK